MNPADEVSRYVESLESEVDADSKKVRAFIQGGLLGFANGPLKGIVHIADVEQDLDVDGEYLHHFTIITKSGRRFRVNVEVE